MAPPGFGVGTGAKTTLPERKVVEERGKWEEREEDDDGEGCLFSSRWILLGPWPFECFFLG